MASKLVTRTLSARECREHIAPGGVGRVAVSSSALPALYSVFFGIDQDYIVLRLDPASPLARAVAGSVVAFSADAIDVSTGEGWSVLVQGVGEEVRDPVLVERLRRLPVRSVSANPAEDRFVRISMAQLSGTALRAAVVVG